MKKFIVALALLLTTLMAACGGTSPTTTPPTGGSDNANTVHMGAATFILPSITIAKGSSLSLVDDSSVVHIITNGSWVNGAPKTAQESGAPTVNNLQFQGNDTHPIGPFNTAGTYHLYCTVHANMNLTVIVQ